MKPHITVYPDRAALMAGAADILVAAASQAIAERGRWTWALSGGSTPEGVYALLGTAPRRDRLDWSKAYVFWGDERCVPPSDPQSNYGMARRALLDHVPIPAANIYRIRGELAPETAAQLYGRAIQDCFGLERRQWPQFDTMLLGLGADGHTASLFPGSDILERHESLVAETWAASMGQYRVSLTLPTINAARDKVFLVAGADKASVVREIVQATGRVAEYPAARIEGARWLLDAAAAAELEP